MKWEERIGRHSLLHPVQWTKAIAPFRIIPTAGFTANKLLAAKGKISSLARSEKSITLLVAVSGLRTFAYTAARYYTFADLLATILAPSRCSS